MMQQIKQDIKYVILCINMIYDDDEEEQMYGFVKEYYKYENSVLNKDRRIKGDGNEDVVFVAMFTMQKILFFLFVLINFGFSIRRIQVSNDDNNDRRDVLYKYGGFVN